LIIYAEIGIYDGVNSDVDLCCFKRVKRSAIIQGESKSIAVGFFADFLETAWNFNMKFYVFIQRFHPHFLDLFQQWRSMTT